MLPAALLDLLLPPRCAVCDQLQAGPAQTICPGCAFGFEVLPRELCPACATPITHPSTPCAACALQPLGLDSLRCGYAYGGSLAEAIGALKFGRRRELARPLARMAHAQSGGLPGAEALDLLLPVPLHRDRFLERGFDQAVLLARELSRLSGVPTLLDGLRRRRPTVPQGRRPDLQSRWDNVAQAFTVAKPRRMKGKRICLVDDVVTSGATLSACARVLREAGAAEIHAFTIGRTLADL